VRQVWVGPAAQKGERDQSRQRGRGKSGGRSVTEWGIRDTARKVGRVGGRGKLRVEKGGWEGRLNQDAAKKGSGKVCLAGEGDGGKKREN